MFGRSIHADHKDLIHDIAYDYYGRRLATCSSDQSVKVWDIGGDGQWLCTASWKTHSGSVWKVTWAHPEFGQILATCSFDRTAIVWEEMIADNNNGERNQSVWIKRHSFVDSRTSVTDVKFAPKHAGLLLATCSSDGIVRIYEAPDVMNVSQWSVQFEIVCKKACSSLSWNPSLSRLRSPMIAVGSDDANNSGSKVLIYEYNENSRVWEELEIAANLTDPVHDIAFAPNVGRSYDLLGVATTKDVKIISITPSPQEAINHNLSSAQLSQHSALFDRTRFDIRVVANFEDHGSQVWRVSWNITGTILASSGDDGTVRLWKANYLGSWKNVGVLKGDGYSVIPGLINNSLNTNDSNNSSNAQTRHLKLSNPIPTHNS